MIHGEVIERPTKEDIARAISAAIGVEAPDVSTGSSVDSQFIESVFRWRTGVHTNTTDVYRATEALLEALDLTYDPYWDTSESRGPTGGGTVTARAYSRILASITSVPRCFLLSMEVLDPTQYAFGEERRASADPFIDAGPGSLVVLIAPDADGREAALASVRVQYVASGWIGPWVAEFDSFQEFMTPVPVSDLAIAGWPARRPYSEISLACYGAIVAAGGVQSEKAPVPAGSPELAGAARVIERLQADFPASDVAGTLTVPDTLPAEVPNAAKVEVPSYSSDGDEVVSAHPLSDGRASRSPEKDRLAEVRAIELVRQAMENSGWEMTRDRQPDRVGYDLEFTLGDRLLKVEVKGIQGRRLVFNLTPKEFWRAQTDEAWVLVAVTSVLSPTEFDIHLRTRDKVVTARRVITGYRMTIE